MQDKEIIEKIYVYLLTFSLVIASVWWAVTSIKTMLEKGS